MENNLVINDLIDHVKGLLLGVRKNYLAASVGVYKLYEGWTGSPDSWVEFYEQELELSKSQVSKMRKVGQFLDSKGLSLETDVSYERLYLSLNRNPDADPKYIISEAQTWNADDYKESTKESCGKPEYITIELCKNCSATKEKHA